MARCRVEELKNRATEVDRRMPPAAVKAADFDTCSCRWFTAFSSQGRPAFDFTALEEVVKGFSVVRAGKRNHK